MVKVSIEVRKGAARFSVAVHAESIAQAMSLVQRRYSGGGCRVRFPIDPEGFFSKDPARARIVETEQPAGMAA